MRGRTITTAGEFVAWLAAGAGCAVYHEGNLAEAASITTPSGQAVRELAAAAWLAAADGRVYLFQRRASSGFQYLAIRPKEGKVPRRLAPHAGAGRRG